MKHFQSINTSYTTLYCWLRERKQHYFFFKKWIFLICKYLSYDSSSPKSALCQVWFKLVEWFRRVYDFKISSINVRNFNIISFWKRAWPFMGSNLTSLHSRMLSAKFGRKWPSGSGEEIFSNFVSVILYACLWRDVLCYCVVRLSVSVVCLLVGGTVSSRI